MWGTMNEMLSLSLLLGLRDSTQAPGPCIFGLRTIAYVCYYVLLEQQRRYFLFFTSHAAIQPLPSNRSSAPRYPFPDFPAAAPSCSIPP